MFHVLKNAIAARRQVGGPRPLRARRPAVEPLEGRIVLDASPGTARDLGRVLGTRAFSDSVGGADTDDFYKFTIPARATVNVSLRGLNADAQLGLFRDLYHDPRDFLAGSTAAGAADEVIVRSLSAGTYFVRVYPGPLGGAINYNLRLTVDTECSDFDGDGRADMTVFRPGDGMWHVLTSSSGFTGAFARQWGAAGDVPIQDSDFDGDGRADIAVFRPGDDVWHVLTSGSNFNSAFARQTTFDYDMYEPRTTTVPIQGSDFDGDGRADMAVYSPLYGLYKVHYSGSNFFAGGSTVRQMRAWGVPIQDSDFDGDGRADIAVYAPGGNWTVLYSSTGYNIYTGRVSQYLTQGIPIHGTDFDGDGRTDMAVFSGYGAWFLRESAPASRGTPFLGSLTRYWGMFGDMAIT